MADDFSERYGDLLTGSYDCVDRIVLNACFSVGHNPGGFRCWWRRLHGGDDRSPRGAITSIERKTEYVYHYSFHIMDRAWGHLTVKMSGHPPFGAQVILNGYEYVACQARAEGIGFTKEGNCFTGIADPQGLAQVARAWPRSQMPCRGMRL